MKEEEIELSCQEFEKGIKEGKTMQIKELVPPEKPALRDQFAMAALTGILSRGMIEKGLEGSCYQIADAMMEARKS